MYIAPLKNVMNSRIKSCNGFSTYRQGWQKFSHLSSEPASVAQLDACPNGDQEVVVSTPQGWQHSFVEI